MSIVDDLMAQVQKLDKDGSGKVDFEDLKAEAEKLGLGDKLDQIKGDLVGEDGKLSVDDAQRALSGLGGKIGETLNDLKDQIFGDKQQVTSSHYKYPCSNRGIFITYAIYSVPTYSVFAMCKSAHVLCGYF